MHIVGNGRRVIDARYWPITITTLSALPVQRPTPPPVRPPRPSWPMAVAVAVALVVLFVASFLAGRSR